MSDFEVLHQRAKSFYAQFERKADNQHQTHYCPGCGHGITHKLIAKALDELGLQDRTILVSPVGCSVFGYYYFDVGNVQVAHGRAPAAATGLKRALPGSIVISYQGDGDLAAIGSAEILHAANRGEPITVFFLNNAIYGMTGGQMAPTTVIGAKTSTSPFGRSVWNEGYPLHVSEVLSSLEAPVYIERVALGNNKMIQGAARAVKKALDTQAKGLGFSLIEVLSPCPTIWKMDPQDAQRWVEQELTKVYPLGVFRDKTKEAQPRPAPVPAPTLADVHHLITAGKHATPRAPLPSHDTSPTHDPPPTDDTVPAGDPLPSRDREGAGHIGGSDRNAPLDRDPLPSRDREGAGHIAGSDRTAPLDRVPLPSRDRRGAGHIGGSDRTAPLDRDPLPSRDREGAGHIAGSDRTAPLDRVPLPSRDRQGAVDLRIKIAGFGGQGVLMLGQILAEAGQDAGLAVSWLPPYGPEMRSGTSNCHVRIASIPIDSPLISKPNVLMALNQPSLYKFLDTVEPGGWVLYNAAALPANDLRKDLNYIVRPFTEIADKLGDARAGNIVMLGALLEATGLLEEERIHTALQRLVKTDRWLELDRRALRAGRSEVKA